MGGGGGLEYVNVVGVSRSGSIEPVEPVAGEGGRFMYLMGRVIVGETAGITPGELSRRKEY